jgi:hypothetical protein
VTTRRLRFAARRLGSPRHARPRLISPAVFVAAAIATSSAACTPNAHPPTSQATSSALTGLGGTIAVWRSHHETDGAQPITDKAGRVIGYVATITPRSLADAESGVRADLPADAVATPARLVVGVEGTKCEIVTYKSATLGRALGGPHGDVVRAGFQTDAATTMDTSRITRVTVVSGNQDIAYGC